MIFGDHDDESTDSADRPRDSVADARISQAVKVSHL